MAAGQLELVAQKIERNRQRDRETERRLTEAGWRIVEVWEHEPAADAADRVARALRERPSALS